MTERLLHLAGKLETWVVLFIVWFVYKAYTSIAALTGTAG